MSAQPANPNTPPDHVNIEIDGKPTTAPKGSMIIQAADKLGIGIPRFCYHDKLPIAANCRMCLVDVEKAPKPMPACATPVMEGMKIYTQSKRSLDAQRNVMEFLLINHPLDCPICDQGGECELQDLAVGYGRSVSRFTERKRVVPDENLGPLVATDMTRCIHCTRCVRFVSEIAGTYELGGMSRGENLSIGTYIGKSLESELSGNIVDVCPVGALTNKVFRFKARPWELIARESIAYHDALGSNLFMHTRRGEVLRCVPRDNETINECWLSDRDRYSHQGLRADDRVTAPLVRGADGALRESNWDDAIAFVAAALKANAGEQLGAFVAPSTSSEEGLLLARIVRALGSDNIDHRLRLLDAGDTTAGPTFELALADVERAESILLVGCNPRLDQPLLGHRVRKAWKAGAKISSVGAIDHDFHFEPVYARAASPAALVDELAALAQACGAFAPAHPDATIAAIVAGAESNDGAQRAVESLKKTETRVVIFGDAAAQHPQSTLLRALARYIARTTGAAYNEVAAGANSVGLKAAGVVPEKNGLNVPAMLAAPRRALLLYGAEVPHDFADTAAATRALDAAETVIAFAAFADDALKAKAHAILPIGMLPEIDATLVNVDATAQTVAAGAKLPGDARPGWRVLRALGAALEMPGFDFTTIGEVRTQVAALKGREAAAYKLAEKPARAAGLQRIGGVATYRGDAVLRRASALQGTPLARAPSIAVHPEEALALGLSDGGRAWVFDGAASVTLPVVVTNRVPRGAAWIETGHPETASLAPTGATLTIERA